MSEGPVLTGRPSEEKPLHKSAPAVRAKGATVASPDPASADGTEAVVAPEDPCRSAAATVPTLAPPAAGGEADAFAAALREPLVPASSEGAGEAEDWAL